MACPDSNVDKSPANDNWSVCIFWRRGRVLVCRQCLFSFVIVVSGLVSVVLNLKIIWYLLYYAEEFGYYLVLNFLWIIRIFVIGVCSVGMFVVWILKIGRGTFVLNLRRVNARSSAYMRLNAKILTLGRLANSVLVSLTILPLPCQWVRLAASLLFGTPLFFWGGLCKLSVLGSLSLSPQWIIQKGGP